MRKSKVIEREIGSTFSHNGKTFLVEKNIPCDRCDMPNCMQSEVFNVCGICASTERSDNTSVGFREQKQ